MMDCQVPLLGHNALRCAGLSRSEARLQMLPATLYLIGCLITIVVWAELAVTRRIFSFRQVFLLILCGALDFVLSLVSVLDRQNEASSTAIGGVASLICLLHLLAIHLFLPHHSTLPAFLDRTLAATLTVSIVLNILSSVHVQGPGKALGSDDKNIIYAEAACLLGFYLCAFCCFLFPRFFAVADSQGVATQLVVPMSVPTAIVFVSSLVLLTIQSCLAFTLFSSKASLMCASMASSFSYLLLVAAFVIRYRQVRSSPVLDVESPPSVDITAGPAKPEKDEASHSVDSKVQPQFHAKLHQLQIPSVRSRSASNVLSETGSLVWMGSAGTPRPGLASNRHGQGGISQQRGSKRLQSVTSVSSWTRIQNLMKRDYGETMNQARPHSGMTYYGSESSYADNAPQSRTTSIVTTFAHAAAGYRYSDNMMAPPVPSIDQRYLQSMPSLKASSHSQASANETHIDTIQLRASDKKNVIEEPQESRRGIKAAISTISHLFASTDRSVPNKAEAREGHCVSAKVSATACLEGHSSLPACYHSSKLFPATEWQSKDESDCSPSPSSSPGMSEVKHSARCHNEQTIADRSKRVQVQEDLTATSKLHSLSLNRQQAEKEDKIVYRRSLPEDPNTNLASSIRFPLY